MLGRLNSSQRAGLADGVELVFHPPVAAAQYLLNCKNLKQMLNKDCQAGTDAQQRTNDEVTTSSHTIGKPNVSGSPSFKDQLINDFIPRIEAMAKKEKEHLKWLVDQNAPTNFIQFSQKYYNNFTQRIKEYQEYAERL
jgi:hypothetical protein